MSAAPARKTRNITPEDRQRRADHARYLNRIGKGAQGTKPKYTPQQMIAAIMNNRGLITEAARELKTNPSTVWVYIRNYPEVEAAVKEARESLLDLTESMLYEHIKNGAPWAIAMVLKTLGKDRGYTEKTELQIGTAPITVNITRVAARQAGDSQREGTFSEAEPRTVIEAESRTIV